MDVILYDSDNDDTEMDSKLETMEMGIFEVETFIDLMRKYGYRDSEGIEYVFDSAQIEPEGMFIYLSRRKN